MFSSEGGGMMNQILVIVIIGGITVIWLSAPDTTMDTPAMTLMRIAGTLILAGIAAYLLGSLLKKCPRCGGWNTFAKHTMTHTVNGKSYRKNWLQCTICGFEKDVEQ